LSKSRDYSVKFLKNLRASRKYYSLKSPDKKKKIQTKILKMTAFNINCGFELSQIKKKCFVFIYLISLPFVLNSQVKKSYDIFSYSPPAGYKLENNNEYLFYSKSEGSDYSQLFLYPARAGQADVEKDFAVNWDFFARNASQGIGDPETIDYDTVNGWQVRFGAARGSFNRIPFTLVLTTFTKNGTTFYSAAVFSHQKFLQPSRDFMNSIEPQAEKLEGLNKTATVDLPPSNTSKPVVSNRITKSHTNFDDGWQATAMEDYVQLKKEGTEVRLHYTDGALDDARPNTTDVPEYYWSRYVEPYFTIGNMQKWSGVQYPVIYFMEGEGIDNKTGRSCYVAIKIVYAGGARPIVIIAPDRVSFSNQFRHPNDADFMLNYNKFALTAGDIVGKWSGSGGGGVEYYNVYSGNYTGMSAVSSTDEFIFNTDGTYSSTYRSAVTNNYSTQFGGVDFRGKYTLTDWTITAGNRSGGKTTTYNAQLIAVKNGYLLFMADRDNPSMQYTLYKAK
jgi:hypothetical protein